MHDQIKNWLKQTNTLEELSEYIGFRSRSHREAEVRQCAEFSRELLERLEMEVELIPTSGNPVILGKKTSGIEGYQPSILIYGHYDVQPEGDLDLWKTDPFEATIENGKLYGRGSADNKGQHFAHIKALEYLKQHHRNLFDRLEIIFVLDGDEERGSFSLAEVFKERSEDFDADLLIVSDGPSFVSDHPTIIGGVRGILTFQIIIQHHAKDLHSGNFGGLARSANLDMKNLLDEMIDEDGMSRIPGFYDNVINPSSKKRDYLKELTSTFDKIRKDMGFSKAKEMKGKTIYEQNQFLPTININGIQSGGVGEERRTIIPAKTIVSIDCRLVPDMDSNILKEKIKSFVNTWAKANGCENSLEIEFEHSMEPTSNQFDSPYLEALETAFSFGHQSKTILVPTLGGSLPLYLFSKYLGKDVFLIPFALPDENNHAPNENLDLTYFENGIISMIKLYQLLLE